MSRVVIQVEHLYKQYRLGQVSTGTIAHDLNRWWHQARGKSDPYEKLTGANKRDEKGSDEYVWALDDVNFDVNEGEVLGIIGKNGAGKSTLLKILSKVTAPTKGNIKIKGRIASLLEVGTGFHPELTGRENVFLNGAILGMAKSEIKSKFDEILEFSGVEKYIDTPVKRYSSGMYVRLAFAVAAHLEPEILIIDEVLAVGDAEFQKRCLGKMKDVSSNDGRTVLFVSHNMKAVSSLCKRSLLMNQGTVEFNGNTDDAIDLYLGLSNKETDQLYYEGHPEKDSAEGVNMVYAKVVNENVIKTTDAVQIEVKLKFENPFEMFHLNLQLKTIAGVHLLQSSSMAEKVSSGSTCVYIFTIPENILNVNMYKVSFNYVINRSKAIFTALDILYFSVFEGRSDDFKYWHGTAPGLLSMPLQVEIKR